MSLKRIAIAVATACLLLGSSSAMAQAPTPHPETAIANAEQAVYTAASWLAQTEHNLTALCRSNPMCKRVHAEAIEAQIRLTSLALQYRLAEHDKRTRRMHAIYPQWQKAYRRVDHLRKQLKKYAPKETVGMAN